MLVIVIQIGRNDKNNVMNISFYVIMEVQTYGLWLFWVGSYKIVNIGKICNEKFHRPKSPLAVLL